jgi:Zn finger protein HypA/HybF involved in hydrogenase expression
MTNPFHKECLINWDRMERTVKCEVCKRTEVTRNNEPVCPRCKWPMVTVLKFFEERKGFK